MHDVYIMKNIYYDPRAWCKPLPPSISPCLQSFYLNGQVPDASVMGFRVTPKIVSFAKRWHDLCLPAFIDDSLRFESVFFDGGFFKDHRHDQSLLGLALYEASFSLSPSLTQYGIGSLLHHRSALDSIRGYLRILLLYLKFSTRFSRAGAARTALVFTDRLYL